MSDRRTQFRNRLAVTTVVMLTGISLMVMPRVLQVAVPSWWTPMSNLMVLCGAAAELLAACVFIPITD
jgi:hypothetical protein